MKSKVVNDCDSSSGVGSGESHDEAENLTGGANEGLRPVMTDNAFAVKNSFVIDEERPCR